MSKQTTIGLLIVHGIGDQNPGDTSEKLVKGISSVYGTKIEIERDNASLPTELRLDERRIKLYEVFWADLLSGDKVTKTFIWTELQALAWLPWLNQKAGLLPSNHYSKFMSLIWTIFLIPVTGILWVVYKGAKTFSDKSKYSKADQIFDDIVGDVTNYMTSVGNISLHEGREDLLNVSNDIHQRFYIQLSKASKECDEIQILAHSLGTVVTYHALTGLLLNIKNEPVDRMDIQSIDKLKRIYTIGCPLGKIRYFWPTTIKTELINEIIVDQNNTQLLSTNGSGISNFKWDNFYHKYDFISGRLERFKHWNNLVTHKLKGGGGVLRSHVIYECSPQFLEVITEGLFGEPGKPMLSKWARFKDRLYTGLEFIFLQGFILVLTFLGTVSILFTFILAGAYFSDHVREELGTQMANLLGILFAGSILFGLILAWYFKTKDFAIKLHSKWANLSAE